MRCALLSRGGASGRMGLARGELGELGELWSGIVGELYSVEATQLRVTSGNQCIPFLVTSVALPWALTGICVSVRVLVCDTWPGMSC